MKTQELFDTLKEHSGKSLLFEYAPNEFVGANYHITEVKHTRIESVDCGTRTDAWNETLIQLWESPREIGKRDFMKVDKALSILDRVAHMKPYDLEAEVRFEYSNASFHTAQLFVNDFDIQDDNLIIKLAVEKTDCKAASACCTPQYKTVKPEMACC
jgi:hypothetical protein